jgi:very-short-patch-repair endonuclease
MEIPTKIVEIDGDLHRDDGDSDMHRDGGEICIEMIERYA